MQNEYNLRLKDAAMHEKLRELTERHAADMGQAEARSAALQLELEQQRVQYEEKLQDAAEHQQVLQHACASIRLDAYWAVWNTGEVFWPTTAGISASVPELASCASSIILHAANRLQSPVSGGTVIVLKQTRSWLRITSMPLVTELGMRQEQAACSALPFCCGSNSL